MQGPPQRSPGTDLPASLQPEVIFQSAVGYNSTLMPSAIYFFLLLYLLIYFGCPGSLLLCVGFLVASSRAQGLLFAVLLCLWSMYSRLLGVSNFGVRA